MSSAIDDIISSDKFQVVKLGPAQAPFVRIGGDYRYHMILKGKRLEELQQLIRKAMESYRSKSVYVEIDIDPVDML